MPARPILITSPDQIAAAPAGSCPEGQVGRNTSNAGQKRRPAELRKNYPAWTRTRRDNIAFPFIENEQPRLVTVDTIVSEHYDDRDPNAARLMERFYYGYNWGWLRWERWEKTGTPALRFTAEMRLCIAQRVSKWQWKELTNGRLSNGG